MMMMLKSVWHLLETTKNDSPLICLKICSQENSTGLLLKKEKKKKKEENNLITKTKHNSNPFSVPHAHKFAAPFLGFIFSCLCVFMDLS